jgi:WD40 repeat protein
MWDLDTGQLLSTLHGHMNLVSRCTVYDQDSKALSASWDKTLRVWDLKSGQTLSILRGHTGIVRCCTMYEESRKALSGADDETLRVLDPGYAVYFAGARVDDDDDEADRLA